MKGLIALRYFHKPKPEENPNLCKCNCVKKLTQKRAAGWTNLMNHIKSQIQVSSAHMEHSSYLLKKNNDLMGKLKNVKVAAKLRKKTNLKPIQRNVTRWTSSFDMVNRYLELKLHLEIFADDRSFVDLLLSPRENNDAEQLKGSAEKLLSVTKERHQSTSVFKPSGRKNTIQCCLE